MFGISNPVIYRTANGTPYAVGPNRPKVFRKPIVSPYKTNQLCHRLGLIELRMYYRFAGPGSIQHHAARVQDGKKKTV